MPLTLPTGTDRQAHKAAPVTSVQRGLTVVVTLGLMTLGIAACTPAEQAEQGAAPSASVQCGTVFASVDALESSYAELDAGIAAGDSPTNLQPIGADINRLTFDLVNQLQGSSKESLTTVQTAAQRIIDTLVKAQGEGTTGDALAQEIAATRPSGLDAAIDDLTVFAQSACAGQ